MVSKLDEKEITESILKKVSLGASDLKIYRALKVSPPTFKLWKNDHQEEYEQAKIEFQLSALAKVETQLNKKIRGGWRRKEKYEVDDEGNEILVSVERQQVDPELNAIMFWLRSHHPEIYDRVNMKRLELEQQEGSNIQEVIQQLSKFDINKYEVDEEPDDNEKDILNLLDENKNE